MSIIDSYDVSEEIVKADIFTKDLKRLPNTAIVCFKKELMDVISDSKLFEEYSSITVCGDEMKIYKVCEKEIIIYRTIMGAPATCMMMEEMHSRGVNRFIFFGSCGTLCEHIENGAFIIPTMAYRDEGTSYHYMPADDFIEIETAKELSEIFEKKRIKYINTKTWTTDALYRETKELAKKRLQEGCKVVDMECSAIMALSKARNIKSYLFLYSEDTLASEEWDIKQLKEDRTFLLRECLKIALEVADEINK